MAKAKAQRRFDPARLETAVDLFTHLEDHDTPERELANAHKLSSTLQHGLRELQEQILGCRRQIHQLAGAGQGETPEAEAIQKQLDELLAQQLDGKRELVDVQAYISREERFRTQSQLAREVEVLREKSLLPIRHPDRDFFLADLLDYAMKDDGVSMEAPIFTLTTKPDLSIWEWESKDGKKHVRVTPSVLGRATQHDKDVLIYVISQLTAALNENEKALKNNKPEPRPDARNRTVRFRVYDYLVVTNRGTGGRDYMDLQKAFQRLRGTTIATNIHTGKQITKETFGIIDRAKIVVDSAVTDPRMQAVEVTISEWLYNAVQAFEVLTIHPDYFRLRKPTERRLYELARKHCGTDKSQWSIGLDVLKDKAGSKASLREFRRMVKVISEAMTLPQYSVQVAEDDLVTFYRKDHRLQ